MMPKYAPAAAAPPTARFPGLAGTTGPLAGVTSVPRRSTWARTTALSAAPPPVFDAVAALLAQVGAHAVAADAVAAESLMRDFGLPPLLVLHFVCTELLRGQLARQALPLLALSIIITSIFYD